jgi:hypothetical protein
MPSSNVFRKLTKFLLMLKNYVNLIPLIPISLNSRKIYRMLAISSRKISISSKPLAQFLMPTLVSLRFNLFRESVTSTKEEVEGFYDFWYNFDSWRSFEWYDKEVNEGSDKYVHAPRCSDTPIFPVAAAMINDTLRRKINQSVLGEKRKISLNYAAWLTWALGTYDSWLLCHFYLTFIGSIHGSSASSRRKRKPARRTYQWTCKENEGSRRRGEEESGA